MTKEPQIFRNNRGVYFFFQAVEDPSPRLKMSILGLRGISRETYMDLVIFQ